MLRYRIGPRSTGASEYDESIYDYDDAGRFGFGGPLLAPTQDLPTLPIARSTGRVFDPVSSGTNPYLPESDFLLAAEPNCLCGESSKRASKRSSSDFACALE